MSLESILVASRSLLWQKQRVFSSLHQFSLSLLCRQKMSEFALGQTTGETDEELEVLQYREQEK